MLLEIIAETVEDAREAEQGGAGRIELVRDLSRGGLTPEPSLIEAVVKAVRIPVRVMLRESEPFETPDAAELAALHAAAIEAESCGAAGFVIGFLRNGALDLEAMEVVVRDVSGPATFHRAFDDAEQTVEAIAQLGTSSRVDRLLTAGGQGAWPLRLERLKTLRHSAPPRLTILPGGGIDDAALSDLAAAGFTEAHLGSAARIPQGLQGRVIARRVADLVSIASHFTRRVPFIDG